MNNFEIQKKIVNFITNTFMVEEDELVFDESLVDQGIIDSTGLIELSSFLEEIWDIHIDGQEMNRTNFGSIQKIISFVQHKLNSGNKI